MLEIADVHWSPFTVLVLGKLFSEVFLIAVGLKSVKLYADHSPSMKGEVIASQEEPVPCMLECLLVSRRALLGL